MKLSYNYDLHYLFFVRISLLSLFCIISYIAFSTPDTATLNTGFDKINHMLAFFVLAIFCQFSFPDKKFIYSTFIPLIIYAIFIEIVQYFLPFRTFSILDIIADLTAIIIYLLVSLFINNRCLINC